MAQGRVNIAVAIGTAAALGGSWIGVTHADAAAAAAKAAVAMQEAAVEQTSPVVGAADAPEASATVLLSNLGALPDLSSTLGAAPAIQLPPLPPVTLAPVGTASVTSAAAPSLVPAPPATAPVVSAPVSAPAAAPAAVAPAAAAAPKAVAAPKPAVVKATKAS